MSSSTSAFTSTGLHTSNSIITFEVPNDPQSLKNEITKLGKLVQEQALTILQLQLTLRDREEKLRHDMEKLFEERIAHLCLQFTTQQQELFAIFESSLGITPQPSHKKVLSVADRLNSFDEELRNHEERLTANNSIRMTRPPLARKDSFGEEHKGPPIFDSPLLPKRGGVSFTRFPEDNVHQTQPPRIPTNSNLHKQTAVSFSQLGIDPTARRSSKTNHSKPLGTPGINTRSISPSWNSEYVTPRNHSPTNSLSGESDTPS